MKPNYCLIFVGLMIVNNASWAYGSSNNSQKSCTKPEFFNYAPSEKTEVVAGSNFFFVASANTFSNSIQVSAKGIPTTIKVTPNNDGSFNVTGTLPSSLKGVYARIAITANGHNNCKGDGGWLIKIAQ